MSYRRSAAAFHEITRWSSVTAKIGSRDESTIAANCSDRASAARCDVTSRQITHAARIVPSASRTGERVTARRSALPVEPRVASYRNVAPSPSTRASIARRDGASASASAMSSIDRPTAWSDVSPKISSAAAFHVRTLPSGVTDTIASPELRTSDASIAWSASALRRAETSTIVAVVTASAEAPVCPRLISTATSLPSLRSAYSSRPSPIGRLEGCDSKDARRPRWSRRNRLGTSSSICRPTSSSGR